MVEIGVQLISAIASLIVAGAFILRAPRPQAARQMAVIRVRPCPKGQSRRR
jgi:hypothetical protein